MHKTTRTYEVYDANVIRPPGLGSSGRGWRVGMGVSGRDSEQNWKKRTKGGKLLVDAGYEIIAGEISGG